MQPETTNSAILGRILVRLRKEKNLGQAEVSMRTGINRSSLSRIEKGDMSADIEQLERIAEALGTTPEHLLSQVKKTRKQLEEAGVRVTQKPPGKSNAGWILAGAALGAALIAAVASSANKDDNEDE